MPVAAELQGTQVHDATAQIFMVDLNFLLSWTWRSFGSGCKALRTVILAKQLQVDVNFQFSVWSENPVNGWNVL